MRIVTLTTDFGTRDAYVASMKGVMLSIFPSITLVDVTHDVPPQDIRAGRWVLEDVYSYFPRGTIHLAVVDPGVGTRRRPVIVEAANRFFVGPDNGLFGFTRSIRGARFWKIDSRRFARRGRTFDGRDIFAPVSALLAKGEIPSALGSEVGSIEDIAVATPLVGSRSVKGEVVTADRFGNLITNIRLGDVRFPRPTVRVGGKVLGAIRRFYAEAAEGEVLSLWNSADRLEISRRNGSAAAAIEVGRGAKVEVVAGRKEAKGKRA